MISDTRVVRFNYWLACSITRPLCSMTGIQCAYGRTIIDGRTFGALKFVNNGAHGMGDWVFELKKGA